MWQPSDIFYMRRALELAKLGRFTTTPNPNVGCVIVNQQRIVGEGYHQKAGEAHAEIRALADAGDLAQGATAYVTLEPCSHYGRTPPCVMALIEAGIHRVIVAMLDPNPMVAGRGIAALQQAGITTQVGLLSEEAEALNRGFLKRMRTGLPYVQLKLAASLDGRTAMASGESKWITSALARQDVQSFRAQSSAILSTSATIIADDPELTVRWHDLPVAIQAIYPQAMLRQPTRIIIDSKNRITPNYRLFSQPGESWLLRSKLDHLIWPQSVEQIMIAANTTHLSLHDIMQQLGQRQINMLWVEAGAKLAGALLAAELVDELIVYIAPKLLGHAAKSLCELPQLTQLANAPEFTITDLRQIGPDLRLCLRPQ